MDSKMEGCFSSYCYHCTSQSMSLYFGGLIHLGKIKFMLLRVTTFQVNDDDDNNKKKNKLYYTFVLV
jgi:hypothetical protein